jgi:hypothetical protein
MGGANNKMGIGANKKMGIGEYKMGQSSPTFSFLLYITLPYDIPKICDIVITMEAALGNITCKRKNLPDTIL